MSSNQRTRKLGFRWKDISIRIKLFIAFSLLVVLISGFIFIYFPSKVKEQATDSLLGKARTTTEIVAFGISPALFFDDPLTAEENFQAALQNKSLEYLVVTHDDGKLFQAHNQEKADSLEYFLPENVDRMTADENFYLTRESIKHDGKSIGYLYTGFSLSSLHQQVAQARGWIALVSLVILCVGILLVWSLSNYLTRPLGYMVSVIDKIRKGDLSQRAEINSGDELGKLAESFNQMIRNLNSSTQELQTREKQFRTLVETMNEGLLQLDNASRILYANERFCEMFGYHREEVVGISVEELFSTETLSSLGILSNGNGHAGAGLPVNGQSAHMELEMKRKSGEVIWTLVSTASEVDDAGRMVRSNAIFADITNLKTTETLLRYKNRELDTFVYRASHDLKAPLNSLEGIIALASLEVEDPTATVYLDLIKKTTAQMHSVLMGLLEVTMLKEGKLEFKQLNIRKLGESIFDQLIHAYNFGQIEFRLKVPADLKWWCDHTLLHSVLQNLISNAVKYHRTDNREKFVELMARSEGSGIRFEVSDNGPGIPVKLHTKIFDMFYRANSKTEGTGLGLYIVKNALERLGGQINLESEEGVGTRFIVHLPYPDKKYLPEDA